MTKYAFGSREGERERRDRGCIETIKSGQRVKQSKYTVIDRGKRQIKGILQNDKMLCVVTRTGRNICNLTSIKYALV